MAKTIFFIADFKGLVFWLESLERTNVRLYIGEDSSDRNSLTALFSAQASLLPRTLGREGEMKAREIREREIEMKERAYYFFSLLLLEPLWRIE